VQKSVGEIAEAQEVLARADELRNIDGVDGFLKIGPISGYQRLAAVGQNEHELQAVRHARLSKDLQRLSLERVMGTRDSHAHGNVLMMGSVSCGPSIRFPTLNCWRVCARGSWTGRS
jgi:hypothetical protein